MHVLLLLVDCSLNVIWVKLLNSIVQVSYALTDFSTKFSVNCWDTGVEISVFVYSLSVYLLILVLYLANSSCQSLPKFWVLFCDLTEVIGIWLGSLKPRNSHQTVNWGSPHLFSFPRGSLPRAFWYPISENHCFMYLREFVVV